MPDDFDSFVVARGRALLRFAYVLCGNRPLAEDMVQEVLARAHQRWSRIERMEAPEAYVRKSIVREYLSWRRRKASTEVMVAEVPERVDPCDSEHVIVERWEMWALLSGLPRAQRAVLVLRFYEDLTEAQTASILGCSVGTVKSQAARGLEKLRRALDPGPGPGPRPAELARARRPVEQAR